MKTNKNKVVIKVRDLAALTLIPLSLWSCSLTPLHKNRDLSKAAPLPANPSWLAETKEKAKGVVDFIGDADLFPQGLLKDYTPAKVKGVDRVAQKISPKYDIRKISSVTPQQLDAVYKGKLKGKGAATIKIAKKYGIDPLFIAALTIQEAGAQGSSVYAVKYNNVAGRLYRDKKSGKWLPIKFSSVEDCLDSTAKHLKLNYVGQNFYTVTAIKGKYCPDITNKKLKDFNDTKGVNGHWLPGILKHMEKIQSNGV